MTSLINKQENSNYMPIKVKEIKEETISNEKQKRMKMGQYFIQIKK